MFIKSGERKKDTSEMNIIQAQLDPGDETMPSKKTATSGDSLKRSIFSVMVADELQRLRRYQDSDADLTADWENRWDDVSDIHYAAFYGDLVSVERLVTQIRNVDALTTDGPKLLRNSVDGGESFGKTFSGFFLNTTPLMMASQQGRLDVVKYLVQRCKAHVNATDSLGITPFAMACAFNHLKVVKYLISRCAYLNFHEARRGMAPLMLACANNHTELSQLLVKHGVDVTAIDYYGRMAIHYASWNYNVDLVEYLHSHDGKQMTINAQDSDGNTPLHLLVSDMEIDETVDLGYNMSTGGGRIVVQEIVRGDIITIGTVTESKRGSGVPGEEYLCLAYMARLGASCTIRNNAGRTVLHTLCARITKLVHEKGYLYTEAPTLNLTLLVMLKILLKLGCIIDEEDFHGKTPAMLCTGQNNWMAFKLLHSNTSDTNAPLYRYKYRGKNGICSTALEKDIESMASSALQYREKDKWRKIVTFLMK